MKLIADSGSTKCDWMIVSSEGNRMTQTIGFNPFFHSKDFIEDQLNTNHDLISVRDQIKEIYFYGAGCSSEDRQDLLAQALQSVFPNTSQVHVSEDLVGAAYATAGLDQGIVCIIGTGSNSCYFDGKRVYNRIPALGYILGDEASGSYFGKILLSNYIYGKMPDHLALAFGKTYTVDKESVLKAVYKKPNANVYLASFMRFASLHITDPWISQMIYRGIHKFAEFHIASHPEYQEVPVHFVGSIAHHFKSELNKVADNMGFKIGKVVQKPIEGLTHFHTNH